eukprot:327729_1
MLFKHLWKSYTDLVVENEINNTNDEFIIGAGLCRTGTSSLQSALNILGYNCYHNRNCLANNDYDFWINVAKIKLKKINEIEKDNDYNRLENWRKYTINNKLIQFDKLYGNKYNGTVDKPSQVFYLDLFEYYKNIKNKKCKIILSIRDNNDQWYNSFISSIGNFSKSLKKTLLFNSLYLEPKFNDALFGGILCEHQKMRNDFNEPTAKEYWLKFYDEWNKSVENNIDIIGENNLLIFNPKDGWKPLCTFLNKPIPDIPFPQSNQRGILKNIAKWTLIYDMIITSTLVLMTGILYYMFLL